MPVPASQLPPVLVAAAAIRVDWAQTHSQDPFFFTQVDVHRHFTAESSPAPVDRNVPTPLTTAVSAYTWTFISPRVTDNPCFRGFARAESSSAFEIERSVDIDPDVIIGENSLDPRLVFLLDRPRPVLLELDNLSLHGLLAAGRPERTSPRDQRHRGQEHPRNQSHREPPLLFEPDLDCFLWHSERVSASWVPSLRRARPGYRGIVVNCRACQSQVRCARHKAPPEPCAAVIIALAPGGYQRAVVAVQIDRIARRRRLPSSAHRGFRIAGGDRGRIWTLPVVSCMTIRARRSERLFKHRHGAGRTTAWRSSAGPPADPACDRANRLPSEHVNASDPHVLCPPGGL